jgi:hypothetical protein
VYKRPASSTSRSGYRTFKEEQAVNKAATSRVAAKREETKLVGKMRSRSRTLDQSSSKENAVSSATRKQGSSKQQHTLNPVPPNLRSIHDFDTPNFDLQSTPGAFAAK